MGDTDERFDSYCAAVERERHSAWQGGVPAALAEVDARFDDLTSGDALDGLRRELEAARFDAAKRARRQLLHALESAVLSARARARSAELARREGQGIAFGGETRSDPEWRAALALESDADKRREIQAALDRALGETDELRREHFASQGEARLGLGYATGRARAEARYPDVDFGAWVGSAQRVIEATDAPHDALLRAAAGRHRVGARPHQADLPRILRMQLFDAQLPADRLFALFDYHVERMRLATPALSREVCSAPGSGAECFPIGVPSDVRVGVQPPGGVETTRRFFGAMGRALAHGFASEALPVERRRALDPALVTAWALLFESLLREPSWIEESPAHQRAEEFAAGVRMRWLLRVRSTAARALCDHELSGLEGASDPHGLAPRFAELRLVATGCEHSDAGYLIGADAELAAVHELRGMALAAQLVDALQRRYGRRFWRERNAGDLLKELWHTGGTYDAEALAQQVDAGPLDVELLVQDALTS